MMKPYEKRLTAIRRMLGNPSREVINEGYDLLFNLWLENVDTSDFYQDLLSIVIKDTNIIEEFEQRIDDMVIREGITDIYLRTRLKSLTREVEQLKKKMDTRPKKIFISYSHKDEIFKDELITMLAGLQRQDIIDAWQDRRIEVGTEWFEAICKALEECDIVLLLVSPDFIASRFIQEEELKRLFQRRVEEGLTVIPIFVRPCLWKSEPVIKDLQGLPKDGKAVISFSTVNGERDQVWAEIGQEIERLAQKL